MAATDDAAGAARGLDALVERIAPRFLRVEPRRRAAAYLEGLPAPVERKNGRQLAEAAGDRTPGGVQDLLARMRRDADAVRADLRAHGSEHLGDPGAVLVLGEAGFVEKGTKAAGVQRQHSGTAGRVGNCQIGAFLAHASPGGRALVGRALHPPERRAKGRERRRRAGVPEPVGFTTEPKLGRTMLGRAVDAGVPCAFAVGDSVHGADHALRRFVGKRGRGHVPAVTGAQRPGSKPVADWLGDVPARARQRLSAGDGAEGPRLYDWAHLPCRSDTAAGREEGLLIRRKIAEPDEFTSCPTLAPEATTLSDPVRVAGSRWTVEACSEAAEGGAGSDEHEVGSRTGRHRRITLAVPAHV